MRVSGINIYPIKSLAGKSLRSSRVEDRGLSNDRRFMLIDEDNSLITQREFSMLALIDVEIADSGFRVMSKSGDEVFVPFKFDSGETALVRVWLSVCEALIASSDINDWFSKTVGTKCRLVQMPISTRRQINETFNRGDEIVSFADGYPILLIGDTSLGDLNSRLETEIPMSRFRPNITISGSEPFAEDRWTEIRIGETIFRSTKPCARCVVTTIDQATGISDIKEPLRTLSNYRKSHEVIPNTFESLDLAKNDVLFGQNLVAENFGEVIKVGDPIEILG